jgi:hypothetical protein
MAPTRLASSKPSSRRPSVQVLLVAPQGGHVGAFGLQHQAQFQAVHDVADAGLGFAIGPGRRQSAFSFT